MTVINTIPLTIAIGADSVIEATPTVATDISSWTISAYFCLNAGSTPIFTLTQDNDGIVFDTTGGTDGIFYIYLTRTQTATLATGSYYLAAWQEGPFPDNVPLATTTVNMVNSGRPTS